MLEFSLWKQLKKRLRRGRRPVWTLGCFMAAAVAMAAMAGTASAEADRAVGGSLRTVDVSVAQIASDSAVSGKPNGERAGVIAALSGKRGPVQVTLHRIYVCGEEKAPLGRMEAKAALRLLAAHPEWTAVLDKTGTVVMEQRIEDLSEACKKSAYMSVDKDGFLSLFDGPPEKEKVLRTFYQLDVRYMESSLPRERLEKLAVGIKVNDLDDYNSVLSSFSDYAVTKSEKVMKHAY